MNLPQYPSVVIVGQVGAGKTTLLNKICNSTEATKAGGASVTRNLFLKISSYGNGFYIMDTPGFGSDVDQLAHVAAIYSALVERPLNRILIAVEFARTSKMKQEINKMLYMLERYKNRICIIVTNWDKSENVKEDETNIKKLLQEINLKEYVLSGTNITGEQICEQIDKLLINSSKELIQIKQTEFLCQYDLENSEFFSFELKKQTDKLKDEFKILQRACIQFIYQQNGKNEETPEIMHALIIALKRKGNQIIEDFQKEKGQTFDLILKKYGNLELAYLFPMHLKKQILDLINDVVEDAQKKMKDYPFHIFNNIKQCPYCGLIWIKVSGCPNTKCGAFPTSDDAQYQPKEQKYIIQFIENKINLVRSNSNKLTNKQQYKEQIQQRNLKGCGGSLNWNLLPPLPQQVVKELEQQGFLDFLNLAKDEEKKINDQNFWSLANQSIVKAQQSFKVDLQNLDQHQNKKIKIKGG